MANELQAVLKLTAVKNALNLVYGKSFAFDIAGKYGFLKTPTTVPTSAATISWGEITGAPQLVLIVNTDATNYIEIGGDSGLTVFKLKIPAGKFNIISPSSATVYWKANSAAVDVVLLPIEA